MILAFICVVYIKRVFTKPVFMAFVKAVGLTLLIHLGFLVPFVDYMVTGKFNVNANNGGWRVEQNIQEYGAFLSQLGQLFYGAGGGNLPRSMGTEGEMPIGVGFGLVLALAVFLFMVFKLSKEEKKQFVWKLARVSALVAGVSLFMSTCYFPWEPLRKTNVLIRYIVINLQFPWRFCTIASVALALLWCCLLYLALQKWNRKVVIGTTAGVLFLSLLTAGCFMVDVLREGNAFQAVFSQDMDTNVESGEEYLPVNAISDDFDTENLYKNESVEVTGLERDGIRLDFGCVNHSETEQVLDLPLLFYKGYMAVGQDTTGTKQELHCAAGNNQVVCVIVPAGFAGSIAVDFQEPVYWRIAEVISLLEVMGVVVVNFVGSKKRNQYS